MSDASDERPWRERMEPIVVPEGRDAIFARLDELTEIQAHRDWVIDGLRAHVRNIEHDLGVALGRVEELEKHGANLELELAGTVAHARNLEERLAEREKRLAEVEEEAAQLGQRIRGRRVVRLARDGILPRSDHPRLAPLFELGNRLWRERRDLQHWYPPDRAADFWYWLLWDRDGDRDLARVRLPLPPTHLCERVVGIGDPRAYVRSGLVDWWQIDGALRRGGFDPAAGGELLELGAGCGRLTQLFGLYAGRCRITGCDVDAEAMRWSAAHLDFAAFHTIPMQPPTGFAADHFDAVYAFSVFSHLPEALHLDWLAELRRILRPGGVAVLTVHGRHVVDEVLAGRSLPRVRTPLAALRNQLERDGFAFVPYGQLDGGRPENAAFFADWDLERYGDSFVLEPYVRRRWSELFEIVAHLPAPDAWQDYVILRKR